jgi:probable HAF family extracellular repeat protein
MRCGTVVALLALLLPVMRASAGSVGLSPLQQRVGAVPHSVPQITDLGTLPGGSSSTATGINNAGQIVGDSGGSFEFQHAVLWDHGTATDLGTLGTTNYGFAFGNAYGINDRGQIVGVYADFEVRTAVMWSRGAITDLPAQGRGYSYAFSINNRGQVVGGSQAAPSPFAEDEPVLWGSGTITNLGTLSAMYGKGSGDAYGINDRDQIVGVVWPDTGCSHAILWDHGTITALANHPGTTCGSDATAINAQGEIVGTATSTASGPGHAVLWADNTVTDLGTLPGGTSSAATAINARGQIVGWAQTASGVQHAALWDKGAITDLGTLPGGQQSYASGINDRGQIVGWATTASGAQHAVLWQTTGGN